MTKLNYNYPQLLVTAIVIVAVGWLVLFRGQVNLSSVRAQTATMIINFSPENKRMFEGTTTEKMTILDALFSATQSSQIKLIYAVDKNNDVQVAAINSEASNTASKRWYFYLNNHLVSTKDINKAVVSPGDKIEAAFE